VHVSPRRRRRRSTGRLRVAARGADSGDQHLDGFLRRRERVVDWGRRRVEDRWGMGEEEGEGQRWSSRRSSTHAALSLSFTVFF
jgi:hypothetical protein